MNFMRWRYFYFLFSLLLLIPGIFFLIRFGLRPSIDFTGGSLIEVLVVADNQVSLSQEQLEEISGEELTINSLQTSGENQYIIRTNTISNEQKQLFLGRLAETGLSGVQELRFETVGPTLGRELLIKTLAAIGLVIGFLLLYLWRQFKHLSFGLAAILAMLHDTLILLGAFSIFGVWLGVEVDVLFVTALLTTLSFSIHDTIVVFDRIRELTRKQPNLSLVEVVNAAVIQTLGRSLNNSITIIIMLVSLVVLGGETIRWFATALLIGAAVGTYSSTFTAAPLLLLLQDLQTFRKK